MKTPRKPLPADLKFGTVFSEHMVCARFDVDSDWSQADLSAYQKLSLDPAASVLHYGQAIFEGLKAFRHPDGSVHLFRPDRNATRLNASARRLSMPEVPVEVQLEAMRLLADRDRDWVPPAPGTLYIRPAMIATEEALGVQSSRRYLYFVITGPSGPYFRTGRSTIRIMVARDWVRAAPGGTGAAKTGGNYAASLLATAVAREKGCQQVMWLDAVERRHVEEVGAMNLMFVLDGVVTTAPTSGTILAGITRESIGVLCRELRLPFVERYIHIEEVLNGLESGDCTEIFGCGTAAVVSAVGELLDGDKLYRVSDGNEGPVARLLRETLTGIQFGNVPDTHGWLRPV